MKKASAILLAVLLHLGLLSTAGAAMFSNLYVFGDSLSDSGQFPDIFAGHLYLRATNRINPQDPDSPIGFVWPQYLSQLMNLGVLLPSTPLIGGLPGTNYAVVMQRSQDILASITQPGGSVVTGGGLTRTRDGYLVEHPLADPKALYVIWGGGDDVRDIRDARAAGGSQAALIADAETAADNIVAGALALARAGANYILVPNLPDIGSIPESTFLGGGSLITAGNDATRVFNQRLFLRLELSGANVVQVDVYTLFQELLSAPTLYGYSREDHRVVAYDAAAFTGIPCSEGIYGAHSASPDPSKYIFFDGIHPSTYTSQILAEYYQSVLEAPAQISILAEMPLSLGRSHLSAIETHLQTLHASNLEGTFFPFLEAGCNGLNVNDSDYGLAFNNRHIGLTSGFSYFLSDRWSAGLAVGHQTGSTDMDNNRGGFDLDGMFFSAMATFRSSVITVHAVATAADLDFENITRRVTLGQAVRTHRAKTTGDYYALKGMLFLKLLNQNGFSLGPLSSLNYQNVSIDGYQENDDLLSTRMNFHDQTRRSLLGALGLFAGYSDPGLMGPVQIRADLAYEKEFKDDPRDVRAGMNTLAGSSFELPAYLPEQGFWLLNLGLNVEFTPGWEFNGSYHLTKAEDYGIAHGVRIAIQTRF